MNNLKCPISLQTFVDPITVPCCGQTFSRESLIGHLSFQKKCPLCRGDLGNFNPHTALKNVIIADLCEVKQFSKQEELKKNHQWQVTMEKIYDPRGSFTKESLLTINLENSQFVLKPSLFIVVCDVSGSMRGNPWNQVMNALLHIMALSKTNKLTHVAVITYSSEARIIDITSINKNNINDLFMSGGTNFGAAFDKIFELLRGQKNNYGEAIIGFLTDGQAQGNISDILEKLRVMVADRTNWNNEPITIHSIGFSKSCDKDFLENIRKSGTREGMFRYADEKDDDDTLCNKMTGLFDQISNGSTAPVDIQIGDISKRINIPIDLANKGKYEMYCAVHDESTINIKTIFEDVNVEIKAVKPLGNDAMNKFDKWCMPCIDDLAKKTLHLTNNNSPTVISLVKQQIRKMKTMCSSSILTQLAFIEEQINNIAKGSSVSVGKLYDMRYSSKFESIANSSQKGRDLEIKPSNLQPRKLLKVVSHNEDPLKNYSFNNDGKNRNELQKNIMKSAYGDEIHDILKDEDANEEEINFKDNDGNNSLHLAAYRGKYTLCEQLCKYIQNIDEDNNYGETAATIAIKKRGYHKTLEILLNNGAEIPQSRVEALQRFCVNNCYSRTADFLDNLISNVREITLENSREQTMDYIRYSYIRNPSKIYFEIMLSKECFGDAMDILVRYSILPTADNVLKYCYPNKPDAANIDKFIDITKKLLDANPDIINNGLLLIRAAEKGSLPHVKLLTESYKYRNINAQNELGNSALWVACAKKYPCIIEYLLENGSDPNILNLKGNSAMYPTCQIGNKKIAELLIQYGANVENVNLNGDTLILIACRNGQHEVLEVLLKYVDIDFVNHKAHIDGFNAILASAEANRPKCIEVLFNYGIDIESPTDSTNAILPNATPLGIAIYYNCIEAAKQLIASGASLDSICNNLTLLQIAVIQQNIKIVDLLLINGASKCGAMMFANSPELQEMLSESLDVSDVNELEKNWHPYWNNIDFQDVDGNTLLTKAVIEGDVAMVSLIKRLDGGNIPNYNNMTPSDYSIVMKNKRIQNILNSQESNKTLEIKNQIDNNKLARYIYFLDCRIMQSIPDQFGARSRSVVNVQSDRDSDAVLDVIPDLRALLSHQDEYLIWKSKLDCIGKFGNIVDNFIMSLYLNSNLANESVLFQSVVKQAVSRFEDYRGEIFINIGCRYDLGTKFHSGLFSGSSLWRVAVEGMDVKTGTILIIQPEANCAKFVGGKHSEVIVLPNTYKITDWFHYDQICLGQANIRENTFKIKPGDHIKSIVMVAALHNNE